MLDLSGRRHGPATKGGHGLLENFGFSNGRLVFDLWRDKKPRQNDRPALKLWSKLVRISSHVDHLVLSLGGKEQSSGQMKDVNANS